MKNLLRIELMACNATFASVKKVVVLLALLFVLIVSNNEVLAQSLPPAGGGPPGGCFIPPCVPIDGGISALVAAGVAFGAFSLRKRNK